MLYSCTHIYLFLAFPSAHREGTRTHSVHMLPHLVSIYHCAQHECWWLNHKGNDPSFFLSLLESCLVALGGLFEALLSLEAISIPSVQARLTQDPGCSRALRGAWRPFFIWTQKMWVFVLCSAHLGKLAGLLLWALRNSHVSLPPWAGSSASQSCFQGLRSTLFSICFLTLALVWYREALSHLRLGTVLTLWLRVPPESCVLGLSCLLETSGPEVWVTVL